MELRPWTLPNLLTFARLVALPFLINAIIEGLWREYKIDHIDMPATAERVWIAIREAQKRHNL